MQRVWIAGSLALLAATLPGIAAPGEITGSVVRIEATTQDANYKVPWSAGQMSGGVGAGFIIDGKRILTNAHVVSNSRFLTVSKQGDPKPYTARVQHIAHDCDLALLQIDDPHFFEGTKPLSFGGIPEIESTVSVFGYPIGGDRLSVTRGIVSRVDFQPYSHSGVDSHLTIQIDAAINPGNSGGPVLQAGKVVGVAFQGYSGDVAQNVGYMIPAPVINRFLADVKDGSYDHYMDLALSYFPLFNPAARQALGLPDDGAGVLVGEVYGGGSADGIIHQGDVLLAVDGNPIASDGSVELEGGTVEMAEIVERKLKGDKVALQILRKGQKMDVTVPLNERWPFGLQANTYDVRPRFITFGGLIFQPVDQNFMNEHNPGNLRLRYLFDHFITDQVYRERPELVALSGILPDPTNSYTSDFVYSIVDRINDHKIQRLEDVRKAFAEPVEYYVIHLLGEGRPIVLERKEVEKARSRIRLRYGVTREENLNS
ncbi:MAG TPA: trypsin-like peptidase domain-containing protein [Chthoniobacterales bacterium]